MSILLHSCACTVVPHTHSNDTKRMVFNPRHYHNPQECPTAAECTHFTDVNSSNPHFPRSRPNPLRLTPPLPFKQQHQSIYMWQMTHQFSCIYVNHPRSIPRSLSKSRLTAVLPNDTHSQLSCHASTALQICWKYCCGQAKLRIVCFEHSLL